MKEFKKADLLKNKLKKVSSLHLFNEKGAHCFHMFVQHTKISPAGIMKKLV